MPVFHVWFGTRSRKWLLQGEIPEQAKSLFRQIAEEHDISLIECEAIVDHVHMLLECDDKQALARSMHLLKGASARRLFQKFPDVKMDAQTLHFWQKGYGSKIVADRALANTAEYIRTQWERLDSFDRPNLLKA